MPALWVRKMLINLELEDFYELKGILMGLLEAIRNLSTIGYYPKEVPFVVQLPLEEVVERLDRMEAKFARNNQNN